MEILELTDHPWYVGVQFHPEYLSRILDPSKPCLGFAAVAAGVLEKATVDMVTADNYLAAGGSLSNRMNGVQISFFGSNWDIKDLELNLSPSFSVVHFGRIFASTTLAMFRKSHESIIASESHGDIGA